MALTPALNKELMLTISTIPGINAGASNGANRKTFLCIYENAAECPVPP
jgi:hypothetical protein